MICADKQDLEALVRRAQAEQGRIAAEMHSRGMMATFGYAGLDKLLIDTVHVGAAEARDRAARALACHDTRNLSGTVVPACAPATGAAFAEGSIHTGHVDALVGILAEIPGQVPPDERAGYETTLVGLAREADPRAVRRAGRHLLERLNQDGNPPADKDLAHPERELRWHWSRDGKLKFTGLLDKESGQLLETLISPLATPRPAQDGQRDTRTLAQRQGDGFAELLDYTQRAADLPVEAGERPTLIVTMTLDQLLRNNPTGPITAADLAAEPPTLNWASPITAAEARRLACDAKIIPAVLGSDGELLDLGRTQRLVTPAQRRALNLRDRGCIHPGCTRPTRWTQAHHITEWTKAQGPSDLSNMCLLCAEHHRLIHHSDWEIRMATDGHPECLPPAFLDPHRRPRRNHTHHPIRPAA
ncbi:MAG: DUF222 domain-containing protein [Micromonosporaceae bacterium]